MRVCVLRGVGESGLAEVVSRQLFFVFFYVKLLLCSLSFPIHYLSFFHKYDFSSLGQGCLVLWRMSQHNSVMIK